MGPVETSRLPQLQQYKSINSPQFYKKNKLPGASSKYRRPLHAQTIEVTLNPYTLSLLQRQIHNRIVNPKLRHSIQLDLQPENPKDSLVHKLKYPSLYLDCCQVTVSLFINFITTPMIKSIIESKSVEESKASFLKI